MSAVHVRDIPPELLEALKRRAKAHRRSLQMELLEILSRAALEAPAERPLPPIRLHMSRARGSGTWRREDAYGDQAR